MATISSVIGDPLAVIEGDPTVPIWKKAIVTASWIGTGFAFGYLGGVVIGSSPLLTSVVMGVSLVVQVVFDQLANLLGSHYKLNPTYVAWIKLGSFAINQVIVLTVCIGLSILRTKGSLIFGGIVTASIIISLFRIHSEQGI